MRILQYGVACIGLLLSIVAGDRPAMAGEGDGGPRWQMAQAGSTGGSIGKQQKSVSGTDAPAKPAVARPPKRNVARATDESGESRKGGTCGKISGRWTANGWWNAVYGRGDVQLYADGSAKHNSGIIGTWTCNGSRFVMDWKNWAHAEGTVSDGGNTITFTDGKTMTRGE